MRWVGGQPISNEKGGPLDRELTEHKQAPLHEQRGPRPKQRDENVVANAMGRQREAYTH